MGEFPNKATIIRTHAHAVQMGKKGGPVRSLKKKYAAKLREMKKKGDNEATIAWFCQRLEDAKANIIHTQQGLDDFIKTCPDDKSLISGISTAIALHKAHFGEKHHNTNLNINTTMDEWEKRLSDKIFEDDTK